MNGYLRRWGMIVVAALAGAALTMACLSTIRVSELSKGKGGLIAYLGMDYNIYTLDKDGGHLAAVTTDADVEGDTLRAYDLPAWAPDGQSLAFAGYSGPRDLSQPPVAGLFVARQDGSNLTQVYSSTQGLIYYYWSPDSQQVGFLSNTSNQSIAMKLVPASGGEAETVDTGAPFYWSWAPDSRTVLVHIGAEDGHLSLFQLGETTTENSLDITPTIFRAPAYSPDGRRMLVAGKDAEGHPALLLTDAGGNNPQTIAEYTGVIAFTWSPDGTRIAYLISELASDGVPGGSLTAVDPSGKQKPVELKDEAVYAFFWSPDSRSIAYVSKYNPPTARLELAGLTSRQQTQAALALKVMDVKRGDTRLLLAPLLPTEGFLRLIPYFDQYHQSMTVWSPDSRNLVISKYYEKDGDLQPGIFVVDASGKSEPRRITDGLVAFWSWK
ncbi:MAG: hypothetical protein HW378_2057 [Anaerolineales bacterium]|nr:hypothetical protein [Anaerolineales bacterium]